MLSRAGERAGAAAFGAAGRGSGRNGMGYLIGILLVAAVLGISTAVVLIALGRLVEILPPARAPHEDEEGPASGRLLR
jgi:hypothetical protein